jgi:glycosyltransferase involved in cell wall biosynthesis
MVRVRVLHIYSGNLVGGTEKALLMLSENRDYCPEMECEFALCFEGWLADRLRASGVCVHMLGEVRLRRPWTIRRARLRLSHLLNGAPKFDVAITHSTWLHMAFGPAVRRAGVPLCFWARDAFVRLNWIDRMAAHTRPDRVLANSSFTLGRVPALFPTVVGEVVYNPLPPPPPMDRLAVREEVRCALVCPQQTTVILMSARFERWKGHVLLLEALSLLKPGDWQVWIAGGPQRPHEKRYYSDLQATAQRLGIGDRIIWLGDRRDIPRILAAADIHCQPNTGPEPFGNAFIEAMQAGLPVVTTRLGAAPEIIDETCGLLTAPGDPRSLANALQTLMAAPARNVLGGGAARAKTLCDPAQQMRCLFGALTKPISASRASRGAQSSEIPFTTPSISKTD